MMRMRVGRGGNSGHGGGRDPDDIEEGDRLDRGFLAVDKRILVDNSPWRLV